jgi:glycosyltransferase involved in cell wall biosynthesis
MDQAKPLFSIIIVVYNGESTISSAIDSVLKQSFPSCELVIIDGGSKDATVSIVKNYQHRVHFFISEPDQGIYDAMNKGIAAAKGEYIYFLGSDDSLFNAQVLQEVSEFIHSHPADIIYGNVLMSASGLRYDGPFTFEKLLTKNISHQAIFYKRSVFQQLGGYNLQYKLHADWDFNLACFTNETLQKSYIDLTIARFTEGSTSSKPDKIFIKSGLIPAILQYQSSHPNFLRSIKNFDFLWRQLRNAQINNSAYIGGFKPSQAPYILHMIRFQSMVSNKRLQSGLISKALMTSCFLYCKLKNAI